MTTVLVVDDSQFMRTVIGNALESAGYDVETAANGEDATDLAATVDPDVVTMDVEMPGMSGIDAVERIMATNPTSIVMLSAYTRRGADATLDALERGAVDFLHKPDGSDSRNIAHLVDSVVETVDDLANADVSSVALARAAAERTHARIHGNSTSPRNRSDSNSSHASDVRDGSRVRTRTRTLTPTRVQSTASGDTNAVDATATPPSPRPKPESGPRSDSRSRSNSKRESHRTSDPTATTYGDDATYRDDPTVVIGASTGGPRIVERVLERLPVGLGAKVVVVQHMPVDFTARFAERLDRYSGYDVREARDGDRVAAGEAVVARGGSHLRVTNNVGGWLRVRFDDGEREHGVRPAIDVTMRSAADRVTDPLVGVVLTGMGKDGAAGIEAISRAGGRTIAQDEATSPVFGIPANAIETGCVDEVVPADELVDRICEAFRADTDLEGETNG